jgi:hypothetical protein
VMACEIALLVNARKKVVRMTLVMNGSRGQKMCLVITRSCTVPVTPHDYQ